MYKEIKNELLELSWVSLMKDTLRYENSFKMCVYIKEKKVKMEGYFRMINPILISQCGLLMENILL